MQRLVARLAVAMAYLADRDSSTGCPASRASKGRKPRDSGPEIRQEDIVRYVLTFAMLCFGPFLNLISTSDSRAMVVLYHFYKVVGALCPTDNEWWCQDRVMVMEAAIREELNARGLNVCLRHQNQVV